MYTGRCPKCEKLVDVKYKAGSSSQKGGTGTLAMVFFICGSCETILSAQVDPLALMTDQTARIKKLLGR